jgi:hypothetical protein
MRPTDGRSAGFGQAEVADLTGSYQVLDGTGHVLDRHVWIDAVLIEQVDTVDLQSLQRRVRDLPDVVRSAIGLATLADHKSKFRGEYDALSNGRKRLADQFLVGERPIDFRRVKKSDPTLHRGANQADHVLPVGGWPVPETHSHAAEAECRDPQAAVSQGSLLHDASV